MGVPTFFLTRWAPAETVTKFFTSGTAAADRVADFEALTGLSHTDAGFVPAAAAIGAQTGLSTFFCLASFALILFLTPPTRFFASWTAPVADRRPVLLVGVLLIAFTAVLFTPALSGYFDLTGPGPIVFTTVLPTLVLWSPR